MGTTGKGCLQHGGKASALYTVAGEPYRRNRDSGRKSCALFGNPFISCNFAAAYTQETLRFYTFFRMTEFSSLNSNEQVLAMLMAYFYNKRLSKVTVLQIGGRIMAPILASRTFQNLIEKNVLKSEKKYFYSGPTEYILRREFVFPAIFELFLPDNAVLLKSIRSLFKEQFATDMPDTIVRQAIHLVAPNQPEDTNLYTNFLDSFMGEISRLMGKTKYERLFESLSDKSLAYCLNTRLLSAMCRDEKIDWEYLRRIVFDRRKNKPRTVHTNELESVFALFCYFATGDIYTELHKSIANPFTLQIAAISELYRGEYDVAYKLYAKAMTANNKFAPEKSIFINPVCNYFFILTSILYGTDVALKKIETMNKRNGAGPLYPTHHIILPLKKYFCDKNDPVIDTEAYTSFCEKEDNRAVAWLTRMMYQRLGILPENMAAPDRKPVWAYLRHEVSLTEDVPQAPELEKLFHGKPLFAHLEIKSVWQMRLEKLIADNESSGSKETDDNRKTMLIYQMQYDYIVPILKKKLKSGMWSAGKELSLRELKGLPKTILDETDHKLINSIYEWDYRLYTDQYIYLLAGCNHVYTDTAFGLKQVLIHDDKPFLIIDKKNDGTFQVSANIEDMFNNANNDYSYRRNTETDYSVFTPSPFEIRTYREILAQKVYPAEAEPLLIKLITVLGGKTEIHSNMVAELDDLTRVDVPPFVTLRMQPGGHNAFRISAIVHASDTLDFIPGQGNITTVAEQDGKKVQLVRSLKTERKNLEKVSEALVASDYFDENFEWQPDSITDYITVSTDVMLPFIQWCKNNEDICIMEWAEGSRIKYHPSINSRSASISFKPKNGWFEVEGEIEIDEGQVVSLQKLLEMMHESGRQKYIRIGDNEYITLSSQLSRILKRIDTVTSESRSHLQMAPAAVSLLGEILDDEGLNINHSDEIDKLRRQIEESSKTVPAIPKTLQAQLRDYQEEGFEWMSKVTAWGAGVCLADDMGLGKTLQTITLLLEQADKGPSLVVAPASVVPNWRNELKRFSPTLNVTLLNQSENRVKDIKEAQSGDVIITTYALLNIQHEELTAREWNVVCLDEAHTIKNANTKMSKAAMQLQAQRKVILTGTPIQNHLAELWNLFQFINPGLLGSAEQFKNKFIQPIEGDHNKERQSQLRRLISPFLLRRTKSDVIEELPSKNEIQLPVELSSDELTMYEVRRKEAEEAVRADKSLQISTLAEITRLRQMACSCSLVDKHWNVPSSKVITFIDLAEGLNDSGNRALVFSQFTSFLDEVRRAMDKAQLPYLYLDGSTPMAKREDFVRDFQSGKCPFFLISLKAGGLGLNLTGANYVIHLDPWWNPAIEQQATDRAYRIGQQKDVTVYHLISQHTIEEKIVRLHRTKRDLADSLLEGSDMAHAMTQEEMLELLQNN